MSSLLPSWLTNWGSNDSTQSSGEASSQPAPVERPNLYTYLTAEKHASGFSSASTVAQVVERCSCARKVFCITGATSVIGSALCQELCKHGATVIMGYHQSESECMQLAGQITSDNAAVGGRAIAVHCDLTSLQTAQQAATEMLALGLPIHGLIHCAATTTSECSLSPEGLEPHFAVNYLNPLLLTLRLLPHMVTSCQGHGEGSDGAVPRVIWAACSAHHISYMPPRSSSGCRLAWRVLGPDAKSAFIPAQAFGQSKLATIMASRQLAEHAAAAGLPVAVFAVHPGITEDGMCRYAGYPQDSLLYGMKAMFAHGLSAAGLLKTPQQAAATVAYAALAPELLKSELLIEDASCWSGCSNPAVSGSRGIWGYLEDCSLSVPSQQARNMEDAVMLWQLSQSVLLTFLGQGHDCPLVPQPGEEEQLLEPLKQAIEEEQAVQQEVQEQKETVAVQQAHVVAETGMPMTVEAAEFAAVVGPPVSRNPSEEQM